MLEVPDETFTRNTGDAGDAVHNDYRLNEEALRREARWALDRGAQGLVAAPSIGEFLHLDERERTRVFEIVIEEARGAPASRRLR